MKRLIALLMAGVVFAGLIVFAGVVTMAGKMAECTPAGAMSLPAQVGQVSAKNLDKTQLKIARQIIGIGVSRGNSQKDIRTALMAAKQESDMRNLSGGHSDSAGVFQQRPSQGWGTYKQVTNVVYATNKFYSVLERVRSRSKKSELAIALEVQRPSYKAYTSRTNNFNSWRRMADELLASYARNKSSSAATSDRDMLAGPQGSTGQSASETTASSTTGGTVVDEDCQPGNDTSLALSQGYLPGGTCPKGQLSSPAIITVGYGNPNQGPKVMLCRVGGIVVNAKIAERWQWLIATAKSQGITLTGGGFRPYATQIALRKKHCGTSQYAIYRMRPSACHPDTARPGESFHETGHAVDLKMNNRVYAFMVKYGPRVGIYRTVPSEWWHWSTRTRI